MKAKKVRELPVVPRILYPLFLGILLSLFAGCLGSGSIRESGEEGGLAPGMYEGIGRGYRGPIYVQVQITQTGIEDIIIAGHKESTYPGAAAMEELLELVLDYGSLDLDTVSGATFSSRGFLEAVEDALRKALNN